MRLESTSLSGYIHHQLRMIADPAGSRGRGNLPKVVLYGGAETPEGAMNF